MEHNIFMENQKPISFEQYLQYDENSRSNLGETLPVLVYRMLEYSIKEELIAQFGKEKQIDIFREAGQRSGEYFGMMDTFGKGADAMGPAIIALVTNLVGDRTVTVFGTQLRGQNLGVGFLVLLFIIGFVLFAKADRLNKERRKASV